MEKSIITLTAPLIFGGLLLLLIPRKNLESYHRFKFDQARVLEKQNVILKILYGNGIKKYSSFNDNQIRFVRVSGGIILLLGLFLLSLGLITQN